LQENDENDMRAECGDESDSLAAGEKPLKREISDVVGG
jgi:hypothetical protein